MTEEEKRAAFDAVVTELQAAKARVDTILAGVTNRTSPFVMDQLAAAQEDYKKARNKYDDVCSKL